MLEAVEWCDYCSIDMEMTGLSKSDRQLASKTKGKLSLDNKVEPRYKDALDSDGFLVCQFGISFFKLAGPANRSLPLKCRAFNMYIMPPKNARFMVHSWVLTFLQQNHFDFNEWVRTGVTSLSVPEQKALEAMETVPGPDPYPDDLAEVAAFFATANAELAQGRPVFMGHLNNWARRLVWKGMREGLAVPVVVDNHMLKPASPEEAAAFWERRDFERSIRGMIGVREVMTAVGASGKPVVTHNGFLDLLFLLRQFFVGTLPSVYTEYKRLLADLLPCVVDTKYITANLPVPIRSQLGDAYSTSIKAHPIDVQWAEGHDRYVNGGHPHEAGYDALMTGLLFAALKLHNSDPAMALASCGEVNRVPIYGTVRTYMNLAGEDPVLPDPRD
ncbi:Ribonuclease CAF1 [Carpediemonas membranifera]|uniref:Ribonuclease CAF1 n=1 Tax=Carpediemonas membranifera TaxID=201153 RepID=A0A8J6B813_9EUKA|nr:Ribonuclease CAF1 [Carpediemonas membranifera]|eukprot:KAG9395069.1 Ribonuclease CAF1 [Carpediemonas membranifera]